MAFRTGGRPPRGAGANGADTVPVTAAALPEPVMPMLATAGKVPAGPGWAFEFKWDGVRAIVAAAGGQVRLTSRNGNDVTGGYPEIGRRAR